MELLIPSYPKPMDWGIKRDVHDHYLAMIITEVPLSANACSYGLCHPVALRNDFHI